MKIAAVDSKITSEPKIPLQIDKQWSFSVPQEIENMADLEKMTMIRSQKRQNQQKVRKFFGSDLKIDVSLNMIDNLKLPAILESDLPLAYFACFMIKYQGIENLFFCLEVEKYKETKFESEEAKKLCAQRIFNTFMENGLPMQINTKKQIIEAARNDLDNNENLDKVFCPSFIDIFSMLLNVYSEFESGELYNQMIIDLTTNDSSNKEDVLSVQSKSSFSNNLLSCGSIYPMKAYYSALDRITYAISSMEKIYDDQIVSKRISINRHRIIRKMIINFCTQRLKLEFPESDMNLRQSLLTDTDASSVTNRTSILSNISQSNSHSSDSNVGRRKDELEFY